MSDKIEPTLRFKLKLWVEDNGGWPAMALGLIPVAAVTALVWLSLPPE